MRKKLFLLSALAVLIAGGIFWSCQKDEIAIQNDELKLKSYSDGDCGPNYFPILAGQTIPVGDLYVVHEDGYLIVEFQADPDYTFTQFHLWVGLDYKDVPSVKSGPNKGQPIPGQFGFEGYRVDNIYTIPLEKFYGKDYDVCNLAPLYIFAHAVVSYTEGDITKTQTAWSEGDGFVGKRWGWYSKYNPCCPPTGGSECVEWQTETAFGGETAGDGKAWWFYKTGATEEIIYAGNNNIEIGTVEYVNGKMEITLKDCWELALKLKNGEDNAEPVKIQGYATIEELPSSRPSAGLFDNDGINGYKGISLSPTIGVFPYYVIHLDVAKCLDEPCE